uniref:Uncharacterized protein n=1 Tax=Romanomermis culicivorax TaxID=13658 RepID=A0A915IIH7_ROMCU
MAGYDIKESLIDPLAPYPFDFVFNEHFLTNVNMHQFDYKPYISNFLFGLFCFIRCLWSGMRTWDTGPTFRHMFYSLKTKDQVRWIVSVDWRNEHQIHFFNFHLGDKLIDYDEPISKQLYEKVVSYIKSEEHYNKKNESIKYTSHDYLIYPMKGSSETMQVMMKKIARRVPSIIDDDGNNGNAWTNYSFIKYFVCGTYNLYPNFWPFFGSVDKIQKSLGYAEQMLNIAGKSLYRGSDPASVCAFIHGFYFSRIEDFYDTLYLHHHKHNNIDWFYLTGYNWSPQYHHPPFTMSFISHIGQPTFVSRTTDHTTDCGLNNRNGLSGYAYISEPVDRCKLEQKSLYNNSLDYLSNIFEYAQNLTQEKLQIGELATYLNQIFDQVRPSYAKHDKTSTKFLKYFIMGTFISTEQKFYRCLVHELTDILIFKPKSKGYPIIILTLNTDYQIINLQDLELNATFAITSFLLISIEETFRKSDSYLSRSFFTRKIETKLLPINTLARDEKARLDWIKLKQSPFLSQLLNISQSYDEAADEDVDCFIELAWLDKYVPSCRLTYHDGRARYQYGVTGFSIFSDLIIFTSCPR